MSDSFGPLELPIVVDDVSGATVGDPLLDVLLAYLQAVVNFETKEAWASVWARKTPGTAEPLPISFVYPHNPVQNLFRSNTLPALFAWRSGDPVSTPYSQEYDADRKTIACLWVPSQTKINDGGDVEAFRNAIWKAVRKALWFGRHPAWVVPGDTYYGAPTRGSVFLRQSGLSQVYPGEFRPHELDIKRADGPGVDTYACLLFTVMTLELLVPDGAAHYSPLDSARIAPTLGTPGLPVDAATFKPSILSVSPSTGPRAGGTSITVLGHQFAEDDADDLAVLVDGVACTNVMFVDEGTIAATTPPGASTGAKDVTVVVPSGASAVATGAFTYV